MTDTASTSPKFLFRATLPIFGIAMAVCVAIFALLAWSSRMTDQIAVERQERLLALVLSQAQFSIAHDQESATVWDEAVRQVKIPDNGEWLSNNLGGWMTTYFGHDAVYVLDGKDNVLYAFADGKQIDRSVYDIARSSVAPLASKLRELLRNPDPNGFGDRVLSAGASEIVTLAAGRQSSASNRSSPIAATFYRRLMKPTCTCPFAIWTRASSQTLNETIFLMACDTHYKTHCKRANTVIHFGPPPGIHWIFYLAALSPRFHGHDANWPGICRHCAVDVGHHGGPPGGPTPEIRQAARQRRADELSRTA